MLLHYCPCLLYIYSYTLQKYSYIKIDGKTAAEVRQSYCDQFQHDEKCLVAVLSITTANAGKFHLASFWSGLIS